MRSYSFDFTRIPECHYDSVLRVTDLTRFCTMGSQPRVEDSEKKDGRGLANPRPSFFSGILCMLSTNGVLDHVSQQNSQLNRQNVKSLIYQQRNRPPMLFRDSFIDAHPPKDKSRPVLKKMGHPDQHHLPPYQPGKQEREHVNQHMQQAYVSAIPLIDRHPLVLQEKITDKVGNERVHFLILPGIPISNATGPTSMIHIAQSQHMPLPAHQKQMALPFLV